MARSLSHVLLAALGFVGALPLRPASGKSSPPLFRIIRLPNTYDSYEKESNSSHSLMIY
jgi:hypothetical protein